MKLHRGNCPAEAEIREANRQTREHLKFRRAAEKKAADATRHDEATQQELVRLRDELARYEDHLQHCPRWQEEWHGIPQSRQQPAGQGGAA